MLRLLMKRIFMASFLAIMVAAASTPTASASTYTLTIVRLECIIKQDSLINGSDEPRIIVDGITMYMGSGFSNGTTKGVGVALTVGSSPTVDVWETDPSPDPDDFIGSFTVTSSTAVGKGVLSKIVGNSNGKYKVFYEVN